MAQILIVDDEEQVRTMLVQFLSQNGHNAKSVINGRAAVEIYKDGNFDVVITDLIMPEMEGIETIRELRRINPEAKIIAISGGGSVRPENYLLMAQKLGASLTFNKPVPMKDLLCAVESLLPKGS